MDRETIEKLIEPSNPKTMSQNTDREYANQLWKIATAPYVGFLSAHSYPSIDDDHGSIALMEQLLEDRDAEVIRKAREKGLL